MDAADYGVPQHRKRVIFIGNRIGYKNVFPKAFRNEITYSTVREQLQGMKICLRVSKLTILCLNIQMI